MSVERSDSVERRVTVLYAAAMANVPPADYWEDNTTLTTGGPPSPEHKTQVSQLQTDLIALGYLSGKADGGFGPGTARAVKRFQRHAARTYRMPQPDVGEAERWKGAATGICDPVTAAEIRKWVDRGWKLPLGRFQLASVSAPGATGQLRSDAATAWNVIVGIVQGKGGTLDGPYGDTTRPPHTNTKTGASKYSFHYSGRAVDINQALGGGLHQRYFLQKETSGGQTFWRIFCKTDKQDGSQGTLFRANTVSCYQISGARTYFLAEGYYIDLTGWIESTGKFERIAAQSGWQGSYNKTEWWHFQYKLDKQATFLDEMELIGITEAKLKTGGWTSVAMLDHAPG